MQRLIIHLKNMPTVLVKCAKGKMKKKTFNTANYVVANDTAIAERLHQHVGHIVSHRLVPCKV